MHTHQSLWTQEQGWQELDTRADLPDAQLVFVFGGRSALQEPAHIQTLHGRYGAASIVYCSTAGEIADQHVYDGSLAVTAVHFEKSTIQAVQSTIASIEESETVGAKIGEQLPKPGLVHAMVFSDGLLVNGTALVKGLSQTLPPTVAITGGLVGDGADFKTTVVGLNDQPATGRIVLIGFYGDQLKVGFGSMGGWDPFGPDRRITRAKGSVLYELDGKPALALYKEYLGEQAKDLPASALRFPLSVRLEREGHPVEVVRTILSVDETEQSLTFAGDMPEGTYAKLMMANFDRLVDGAAGAATLAQEKLGQSEPELAILISCVGRKLVLRERIEEELDAVRQLIGTAAMTGFYSYGELCPGSPTEGQCELHNQTMTITTFREA